MNKPTDEFQLKCLLAHNEYRKKHGANALEWCDKIAESALEWAKIIAGRGILTNLPLEYGENQAFLYNYPLTAENVVGEWYAEIKNYDWSNPGFNYKTGHFTQVIWADSKKFGIAYAIGPDGAYYIVARYSPPGNYQGKYESNVKPIVDQINSHNNLLEPFIEKDPSISHQIIQHTKDFYHFQSYVLNFHNEVRARLKLIDLKWSEKLENYASKMADAYINSLDFRDTLNISRDQITFIFNGYLPSVEEILVHIFSETTKSIDETEFQKNTNINPIYNRNAYYIGAAQRNDGENKMVVVFIYNPGRNMAIIIN